MPTGVLPIQKIRQVMRSGFITGVPQNYLNPASLDLPCSKEAYILERSFLPQDGETVRSKLKAAGARRFDLKNRLEVGVSYLIRIEGNFRLPSNVYAYANPKSSTGRIFVLVRVVADGVSMYDALIGPGWKGEVWLLVKPEAFPVEVPPGEALAQIRLFDGKSFLDETDLNCYIEEPGLFFAPGGKKLTRENGGIKYHSNSFLLTIGLPKGVAGWECSRVGKTLDLSKRKFYQPDDFFSPVRVRNGRLDLRKGSFYILTTYEHLIVPDDCAAELRAIDPRFGEFRSHSAGFFDSGWGKGVRGQPITLEITPHEDMTVEHRQTIARVRYERMKEVPHVLYGAAKSNYTDQVRGARLSKHFRQPA